MYRISYIPFQFIKSQFSLIELDKIKILSDGIIDPQSISYIIIIQTWIYI